MTNREPYITRTGRVNHFVGDNFYDLHLKIGNLRALETARKAGMGAICERLRDGSFYVDDVVETIYHGLVGAETYRPAIAREFVELYITDGNIREYQFVAYDTLINAMAGDPKDKASTKEVEGEPGELPAPTTPTA